MQSKQEFPIDARSFMEIWDCLSPVQHALLRDALIKAGCAGNHVTVWMWGKGKTAPRNPIIKDTIAKVVTRLLRVRTTADNLFPMP